MKKRGLILFLSFAVLAIAAMIFVFSAQDGEKSSKTSGRVTDFIIRLTIQDYDQLPAAQQRIIHQEYEFWVRKAAHFMEFCLLGLFLRLLLYSVKFRWPFWGTWIGGTLYAVSDELHQRFVSKRAAMWQDVCIDSAGVLFGVLLAMIIIALFSHRKKKAS